MVADLQSSNLGTDFCNDAGGLMAESQGFSNEDVAVAEVRVVMEVGTAETG
jgi:hypothetical protein